MFSFFMTVDGKFKDGLMKSGVDEYICSKN